MLHSADSIDWRVIAPPLTKAERALGRLAHGLETTPLHATWLWREITRVAVTIAQASGHLAKIDQLRLALIGVSVDPDDNTAGLAVAKRIFLTVTPLFRKGHQTDSNANLWPEFWTSHRLDGSGEAPRLDEDGSNLLNEGDDAPSGGEAIEADGEALRRPDDDHDPKGAGEGDQLLGLVRELAGFAEDGRRPALINLLVDLRRHAGARHVSPQLLRLALPLALAEAGMVPKAAPGLLGGRRLPLGMSRAAVDPLPLTDWLTQGLNEMAREADQSYRRLAELTRQHRAWSVGLARAELRRHAKAPAALDLLAATPVLSIGVVAKHLGCSHVAAGKIVERLAGLGILIEQTSRARHKIFIAGDLPTPTQGDVGAEGPLSLSDPAPSVDVDALSATLDGLFADLDRLNERARERTGAGGGMATSADADQA